MKFEKNTFRDDIDSTFRVQTYVEFRIVMLRLYVQFVPCFRDNLTIAVIIGILQLSIGFFLSAVRFASNLVDQPIVF